MNIDAVIERYVALRDKRKEIEERHKAELSPFKDAMAKIENVLLGRMNEMGVDSVKSKHGTAYKSETTTVSVADWDSYLQFVQATESWHMLERRAAKTAVNEYVEQNDDVPPGLNITRAVSVNFRRS